MNESTSDEAFWQWFREKSVTTNMPGTDLSVGAQYEPGPLLVWQEAARRSDAEIVRLRNLLWEWLNLYDEGKMLGGYINVRAAADQTRDELYR